MGQNIDQINSGPPRSSPFEDGCDLPPEDLRCPHCGYAVFGLPDERCPECGGRFSWEDVRAVAEMPRLDLFEYHWRDRPVRSLAKTCFFGAMKPWALWGMYDARDVPRLIPLLILIAIQWLLFTRGYQVLALVVEPAMNWASQLLAIPPRVPVRFVYRLRLSSDALSFLVIWYVATYFALLLFFESSKAQGARWLHVLRIYAHSTLLASISMVVWFLGEWAIDVYLLVTFRRFSIGLYDDVGRMILTLALCTTWVSMWIGYRRYLAMPWGWAVAGLSFFVGKLASDIIVYYLL